VTMQFEHHDTTASHRSGTVSRRRRGLPRTVSEVCLVEFICKLVLETSPYVVTRTPPSCAIIMLGMDHNTSFRMLCVSKYTEKVGGSAWQAVFICHSSAAVSRWRTRLIKQCSVLSASTQLQQRTAQTSATIFRAHTCIKLHVV